MENQVIKNSYPVFIDVDRTILSINSGTSMIMASTREGILTFNQLLEALFLTILHRSRVITSEKIISRIARFFAGKSESVITDFSDRLFNDSLSFSIRPGALSAIEYHRSRNAELVILSASTNYTCIPLMRELKITNMLCTEMEIENGIFTGKPKSDYCFGLEKLNRAARFCNERGYHLKDAWYYGDSISDLPILEAVGNPRCVVPDKKLKKIAGKRGWDIEEWGTP
jgi:HAD superfamily hydrolase (TIGR01490 family)